MELSWLQAGTAILGLLVAYLLYKSRSFNHWKNQGIPYVRPFPIVGSIPLLVFFFSKKSLVEVDIENHKKYGQLYGAFEGYKPVLVVTRPDLLKDIFIKDFNIFPNRRDMPIMDEISGNMLSIVKGEQWKRVRSKMSPSFSTGKMKKMAALILECADVTCRNLERVTSGNQNTDLKKIIGAFTMDSIATTGFGLKIDSHQDPDNPFVKHAQRIFSQNISFIFFLLFFLPRLALFFRKSFFPPDIIKFFKDITEKLIRERKENPEVKRYDILQLMLDELEEEDFKDKDGKKGLSMNEILAQAILLFIAGYETTASAICFTLYNLAMNPEYQDRLHQELTEVLVDKGKPLDYDTVRELPYMEAVLNESLRMFSPATRMERVGVEDYKLGDTGVVVEKGTIIQVAVHAMHHDPELFPDPDQFMPERFLPDQKDHIQQFSFLPFGTGPRNCVAERFALMEAKLCLATVLQRFSFHRAPETKVPLEFYNGQGLLVPKEVILKVVKRN